MSPRPRPCEACGAERGHLLGCPIGEAALGLTRAPPPVAPPVPTETDGRERHVRRYALPAILAAVVMLHAVEPLAFLMRLVAGMWLHEVGHALVGWFTGHVAVPLPWVTPMSSRGALATVLLVGGFGALGLFWWKAERRGRAVGAFGLVFVALVGRAVSDGRARMLTDFAGDAGAMVLGTLGLLTLFAAPGARVRRGGLRWGLAVLGAMAYVDALSVWVAARRDPANIPFGTQEYAGPSDALRLVESAGWSESQLVQRYLAVGVACALGLLATWVVALVRDRRERSG